MNLSLSIYLSLSDNHTAVFQEFEFNLNSFKLIDDSSLNCYSNLNSCLDRRRLKIGACVLGGCIILVAIIVPSVTQSSGDDNASAPPRPYSDKFTFEESSAEMRAVRRALKEVPLIDTYVTWKACPSRTKVVDANGPSIWVL